MKKVTIKDKEDYIYHLIDDNNEYELKIEFYDLNILPKKGDNFYLDEKLLREKILLSFGLINNNDGKDINLLKEDEILIVDNGKEKIYLKRYYG